MLFVLAHILESATIVPLYRMQSGHATVGILRRESLQYNVSMMFDVFNN